MEEVSLVGSCNPTADKGYFFEVDAFSPCPLVWEPMFGSLLLWGKEAPTCLVLGNLEGTIRLAGSSLKNSPYQIVKAPLFP